MIKSLIFISSILSSISYIPINDNNIMSVVSLPTDNIEYGNYDAENYYISDIYNYYYQNTQIFLPLQPDQGQEYTQLIYEYNISLRYYVNKETFDVYYMLNNVVINLDTNNKYSFCYLDNEGVFTESLYKSSFATDYPYFVNFDLKEYIISLQEQDFDYTLFNTLFTLNNQFATFSKNVQFLKGFYYYVNNDDLNAFNLYIEMNIPIINHTFSANYTTMPTTFPYNSMSTQFYNSYYNNQSYYSTVGGVGSPFQRVYDSANTVITLTTIYNDAVNFVKMYNSDSNVYFTNGYNQGLKDGEKQGYANGYSVGLNDGIKDNTIFNIFNGILNIAMVPVNFFLGIFNFEILGINMAGFVSALLTISIIIYLLRLIKGSKTDD